MASVGTVQDTDCVSIQSDNSVLVIELSDNQILWTQSSKELTESYRLEFSSETVPLKKKMSYKEFKKALNIRQVSSLVIIIISNYIII